MLLYKNANMAAIAAAAKRLSDFENMCPNLGASFGLAKNFQCRPELTKAETTQNQSMSGNKLS